MADTDPALYNLRYNQTSQGLEGFGGGSPMWTSLPLLADGGISQLTGEVAAGPGIGSQVATVGTIAHTLIINPVSNQIILGGVTGGNRTTITAPTPAISRTLTIPSGISDATFIMDHGASQSIGGSLTVLFMTAQEYIISNNDGILSSINSDHVSGNPQNTIIPDTGSGSTSHFVVTETAQTLNGTYTFSKAQNLNISPLATSGTITPVATSGPTFTIAVAGDATLNGPSGGVDGQEIKFRILNDGSHSVTLATGSGNFRFGTSITGYTNSVSLTDYIRAIYNAAATTWDVAYIVQGF